MESRDLDVLDHAQTAHGRMDKGESFGASVFDHLTAGARDSNQRARTACGRRVHPFLNLRRDFVAVAARVRQVDRRLRLPGARRFVWSQAATTDATDAPQGGKHE
jgi:hypothetical protein